MYHPSLDGTGHIILNKVIVVGSTYYNYTVSACQRIAIETQIIPRTWTKNVIVLRIASSCKEGWEYLESYLIVHTALEEHFSMVQSNKKLSSVFSRFQLFKYTTTADIQIMYSHVLVAVKDRGSIRFLWGPDVSYNYTVLDG